MSQTEALTLNIIRTAAHSIQNNLSLLEKDESFQVVDALLGNLKQVSEKTQKRRKAKIYKPKG